MAQIKNFSVEWKGLKEIEHIIEKLGRGFTRGEQMQAMRYALTPTRNRMRDNIPRNKSGNLWESIAISEDTAQRRISKVAGYPMVQTGAIVGARKGRGRGKQGWHSHLLEWGSRPHDIKAGPGKMMPIFKGGGIVGYAKSISHPGISGKKIFSKAVDSTIYDVKRRMLEKYGKILEKNCRK